MFEFIKETILYHYWFSLFMAVVIVSVFFLTFPYTWKFFNIIFTPTKKIGKFKSGKVGTNGETVTPLVTSNLSKRKLIAENALYGLIVPLISIAFIFFFFWQFHDKWMNSWQGKVVSKYTYKTSGRSSRITHYMLSFKNGYRREVALAEYHKVKPGNFVIKPSGKYTLKIISK